MSGGQSRIELLQGTLDFIVLQTLRWGPQHGFGLAQMIRAHSSNTLQVDTGSLYPALHRLEQAKLIAAKWDAPAKANACASTGSPRAAANASPPSARSGSG